MKASQESESGSSKGVHFIMVVSGAAWQSPAPAGSPIPCGARAEALGMHTWTGSRMQQDLVGRFFQNKADLEGWHKIWH